MKCHAIDKTKDGLSYNKTAAKYKGKSDAGPKPLDKVTKEPNIKLKDGMEEEHKVMTPELAPEKRTS